MLCPPRNNLSESEDDEPSVLCCCVGLFGPSRRGYQRLTGGTSATTATTTSGLSEELAAAVTDVRGGVHVLDFPALRSLSLLVFSGRADLRRIAAAALVDASEQDAFRVQRVAVECAKNLLEDSDPEVQRAAAAALGNLAVNPNNQVTIVEFGVLEPLVSIMSTSDDIEVQCNAVGCITNLATHDDNKDKIAQSGALIPLTKLAASEDLRVQRNATGALLNMTHTVDNRMQLVSAELSLFSNIAVDYTHRKLLSSTEPNVVVFLIRLTDSPALKVQCQATLALRNLASDDFFQVEIVKQHGLSPLHQLLQSQIPQIILASVACIRNISIHPSNESPIVEAGFLPLLLELLVVDNPEIQCHSMSTIRNLASSDENKAKIIESGAIQRIGELLRLQEGVVSDNVKSEMTACLAVLALMDEAKPGMLKILKYLIRLTSSPDIDVRSNSAFAIGNSVANLNEKETDLFISHWSGVRKYIAKFIKSSDYSLRHIAVWTLVQCVSGNDKLKSKLLDDEELLKLIETVSKQRLPRGPESVSSGGLVVENSAEELSQTLLQELKP
ncbi:ARM repeat-containing protein [Rhizoclosmatium globosum]|uniref:Vacuolar protein 8 n=1 Tax=Rhizoclosmatium globosum TaxID=329046 RepID=A0A1Y2CQK4_9FUNG|nr:ARM repeat-containing protein [Rhizoclosmatium globosum]|eukprot:ORY49318.1 ARM repeat-containing protein [Rhizoclosmatium globosum]